MPIEVLIPSCNLETVRDGRGGIFTWLPQDPLVEFNMLYFRPGKTRGHHYHPEFNEYFLVVDGSGVMVWRDSPDQPEQQIHMSRGSCVRTPKGTSHTFYAITRVTAISLLSKRWDDCHPPIVRVDFLQGEKVPEQPKRSVAVVGANGYVGSALCKALIARGDLEVVPVTRDTASELSGREYDIVINCAMPSARFRAKKEPTWDFAETVTKTADLVNGWKYKKFIQVSSISARSQPDTVYGRHKAVAEQLCGKDALIVRLGPMYSENLQKGVLADMAQGKPVFVSGESRYCFAPLDASVGWIAANLDKTGIHEVGGRNAIALKDLAAELGLHIAFEGEVDHQEVTNPEPTFPDARNVVSFMQTWKKTDKPEKVTRCRLCGNTELVPCIDIGEQYLSSVFPTDLSYRKDASRYPLDLVMCVKRGEETCGLVQLGHRFDLTAMYDAYPYTSSTNSSMGKILEDVAKSGRDLVSLDSQDVILDIGGNDATLLSFFRDTGSRLINIDPAQNVKSLLADNPTYTHVRGFFTRERFEAVSQKKAKLMFSVAMFYHLDDPLKLVRDAAACLDDDGVWVIQMAYLPAMIRTNMYDNIVHEHAGYYAAQHMRWLLERAGLEMFDVAENDVYGGSFRVFAKKKGSTLHPQTERCRALLARELQEGLFDPATYHAFMARVAKSRDDLRIFLQRIKAEGKSVWIYGASTKGNTILQYCGLGNMDIVAAADSNPFKPGKYMIGSDIPIKTEEEMRAAKPDYLLALPYSFVNGFRQREEALIAQGTKFIVPLPEVRIM